jgi:hypothetical protein
MSQKRDEQTSIYEIDKVLHRERIDRDGKKVTYDDDIKNLPDGTFILMNDNPYLLANRSLYIWSPSGYGDAMPAMKTGNAMVLTPKSIVNTFKAGYTPQMNIGNVIN